MSRLSQMITHRLNTSGMTEREVARKYDILPQSLGQWKEGRTVPTSMSYVKLAKFLSIAIDDMVELAEEAKISRHTTKLPPGLFSPHVPAAHPVIADRKVGKFRFDDIPKELYSFKVDTKVMEPALLVGKSATADPAFHPVVGHDVIVFGKAGNAWIGQLESTSADPVNGSVAVISRYSADTLTIKDVQAVHVLVSSDRA